MSTRFLDALRSGRVLLMDGAMGTELQKRGLQPGESAEMWNVTHPERVRAVHQAYVDAGAEVLLTNTFQAHSHAAMPHGNESVVIAWTKQLAEICSKGQLHARDSCSDENWVLADLGPHMNAESKREFGVLWPSAFAAKFIAPIDGLLFETCSTAAVRRVLKRARDWECSATFLLSLTFAKDARNRIHSKSNRTPEWFATRAGDWDVSALGVNCGKDITVADCAEIIRRYRQHTDLPLFARPNAGTPTRVGDQWIYPRTPEQMAAELPELLEAGVSMIGGCCGTTPVHIAAFRRVIDQWNARH